MTDGIEDALIPKDPSPLFQELEGNPNVPDVSLELPLPAKATKRNILTAISSEPVYYNGSTKIPSELPEAHRAVEYLRSHGISFLGQGGNDIFSAQYLKMFVEKAAGKKIRLKIELTVVDDE